MPVRNFIRRMSLTHRLLALTLAACLPGLVAVGYGAVDLRNTRYAEVRAEAVRNAHFLVAEIDQVFEGIAGALRSLWVVAAALVLWSAVIWWAERRHDDLQAQGVQRGEGAVTIKDGLVIGLVQCFSLIPGVSRSGARAG